MASEHQRRIREEFTRQAAVFAAAPEMRDEQALDALRALAGARPDDVALDAACGPGIVVCSLARVVARATGIDLTPAMIERARALQGEKAVGNVSWHVGDVHRLPYADEQFSLVTSRYALHHVERPQEVVDEMARVCRSRGRVVIADVVAPEPEERAAAFNRTEQRRDPSHVRARTLQELGVLVASVGLEVVDRAFYHIEFDVEVLLAGSFPADGDRDGLREIYRAAADDEALGLCVRRDGERLLCAFPIAMLLARRGA